MKTYRVKNQIIHNHKNWKLMFLTFTVVAVMLSACGSTSTPNPTSTPPVSPPSPQPTETNTGSTNETDALVAGAKSALADELNLDPNEIQLVDTQPVQWPDGCLGVQPAGVMCAMHVVDGYRITFQAQGLTYEVRSNKDGSQYAVVPDPVPGTTGFSFTSGFND
jgi:hypothetical protein